MRKIVLVLFAIGLVFGTLRLTGHSTRGTNAKIEVLCKITAAAIVIAQGRGSQHWFSRKTSDGYELVAEDGFTLENAPEYVGDGHTFRAAFVGKMDAADKERLLKLAARGNLDTFDILKFEFATD